MARKRRLNNPQSHEQSVTIDPVRCPRALSHGTEVAGERPVELGAHIAVTRIGQTCAMNEPGHDESDSLLTPGRNCWRVETADRFAVLMENAAYFDALRSALGKARQICHGVRVCRGQGGAA